MYQWNRHRRKRISQKHGRQRWPPEINSYSMFGSSQWLLWSGYRLNALCFLSVCIWRTNFWCLLRTSHGISPRFTSQYIRSVSCLIVIIWWSERIWSASTQKMSKIVQLRILRKRHNFQTLSNACAFYLHRAQSSTSLIVATAVTCGSDEGVDSIMSLYAQTVEHEFIRCRQSEELYNSSMRAYHFCSSTIHCDVRKEFKWDVDQIKYTGKRSYFNSELHLLPDRRSALSKAWDNVMVRFSKTMNRVRHCWDKFHFFISLRMTLQNGWVHSE